MLGRTLAFWIGSHRCVRYSATVSFSVGTGSPSYCGGSGPTGPVRPLPAGCPPGPTAGASCRSPGRCRRRRRRSTTCPSLDGSAHLGVPLRVRSERDATHGSKPFPRRPTGSALRATNVPGKKPNVGDPTSRPATSSAPAASDPAGATGRPSRRVASRDRALPARPTPECRRSAGGTSGGRPAEPGGTPLPRQKPRSDLDPVARN